MASTSATPQAPAAQNTKLVIEGDLTRIERVVTERTVKTSDLLTEIGKMQPIETGLLPRGTISYMRSPDQNNNIGTIYVLERPAGLITLKWKQAGSKDRVVKAKQVVLSWPYVQWTVKFVGKAISMLYLCCTTKPIESLDDPIFTLPMPNQYLEARGEMCLGDISIPENQEQSLRVMQLINEVLQTNWNSDLAPCSTWETLGFGTDDGLAGWDKMTKDDKDIGLKLKYQKHAKSTLNGLLKFAMERGR